MNVLIVEDNDDSRTSLEAIVARWGYATLSAKSGSEAIEIAEHLRPRVVLLDLALPDRHGYDIAADLRRASAERAIFFVVVTGSTQLADQLDVRAAGISHHLLKPLKHDVLREILAAYAATEERASL